MTVYHWMLDKLNLSKEQMAAVANEADRRGVSIASVISEAVKLWLERVEQPAHPKSA